jgi:hypothetical protein
MGSVSLDNPIDPAAHVPALADSLGTEAKALLDKLTARQRRFVEEYPKDLNATAAARRAGYSPKGLGKQGYENLRNPDIIDALTAVMKTRSKRTGLDRSWVLAQLADAHDKVKGKDTATAVMVRLKCLELIGRHVDVRAFRIGLGFSGGEGDNDEREIWDLSKLNDEEFEVFERLLAKVTIVKPHAGGTGGAPAEAGPGADSSAPRGDSGDL